MPILQETRYNLPPKTRAEVSEVAEHLVTGIKKEDFLHSGTLVCNDGAEILVPTLRGVYPGFRFEVHFSKPRKEGFVHDLVRLGVYDNNPNGLRRPRPVLNIFPNSMAIVERHYTGLDVGVFGFLVGGHDNLMDQEFELVTHGRRRYRPGTDELYPHIARSRYSVGYHPRGIEMLQLKSSELQHDKPDKSNFVIIDADRRKQLPFTLRVGRRGLLGFSDAA